MSTVPNARCPIPATAVSGTLVLQDFKHKAANRLEALLARDPRFAEFTTQVARTRSAIQQDFLGAASNLLRKITWSAIAPKGQAPSGLRPCMRGLVF